MSEATSPPAPAPVDPLEAGRLALARHSWTEAFELLARADGELALGGADLEALAEAAFFSAKADIGIEAKERAFKARLGEGDATRAAFLALDLAREYAFSGRASIASGWVRRAERILPETGDTYAHGFLDLYRSDVARQDGRIDEALALAQRAIQLGEASENADLRAFAMTALGQLKIAGGETDAGFALMEEASLAAVNGELSPMASGVTACQMISVCRDMTDYRRATEWIEATERYCKREEVSGFPGVCRVHRAEVKALNGAWEQAEHDLEEAATDLARYNAGPIIADGYYAIGEIRRLKGDFAGAATALREAHVRGRQPQPALALVRLGEGKVKAAATAINTALAEETFDRWARMRMLPAQVEIALAAGDVELARAAATEYAELVEASPSPALEATRQVAEARLHLVAGEGEAAAQALRSGIRGWREVGAPYEVARARALLSHALRLVDNDSDADLELQAAIDEFRRLGAAVDAATVEREQRDIEDRRSGPVQVRKTFMFTDIVGSTALAEALGDVAWERLLRWHDDTLQALFSSGGGELVNSTGDGYFVAFESARSGIDCAISVQRALRDHRAVTGFAISVRIGLHTAEANRRGADYSGMGVHVAARVAALAGGEEILATAETLAEAGDDITTFDRREAVVRGASAKISLVTIAWA